MSSARPVSLISIIFAILALGVLVLILFPAKASGHNSDPPVQEDSLVVTAAPANVNRGGNVTVTATVLAHRTGPGSGTSWNIQIVIPAGYALETGMNPRTSSTSAHGSAIVTWSVSAPLTPSGPDTFTVIATALDTSTLSPLQGSPEEDTFAITTINRAPVAAEDLVTITEDSTSVTILVLSNDSDPDKDVIVISSITQPTNGTAQITDANTSITYMPDPNFYGADSIDYTIQDGYGGTTTATVTITVTSINDVPVGLDDSYVAEEDKVFSVPAPGVLWNDTDIEGDALLAALESGPSNGVLELDQDGSFIYIPDANFSGSDSFTYMANDGSDGSNVATVTISITSINDTPVAEDDEFSTDEDVTLNVVAPGVLGNDNDVDTDPLTAALVSDVSNGVLTLNADGSFDYTPDGNFNGADSFTYVANDGTDDSNVAAVSIEVSAVNDPPTAHELTAIVDENGEVAIILGGNDIDGQSVTYVIVEHPTHGIISNFNSSTGELTYAPLTNYHGQDSLAFVTSDGITTSSRAQVLISINPLPPSEESGSRNDAERGPPRASGSNLTHAPSYFVDRPLEKVPIGAVSILDSQGRFFASVSQGEQVRVSATFTNNQRQSQTFAFIIQVTDDVGFTNIIFVSEGTVLGGQSAERGYEWQAGEIGEYTARIFIWDRLYSPTALSDGVMNSFKVRP